MNGWAIALLILQALSAACTIGATCVARDLVPTVRCWGPLDPHEPQSRGRGGSIVDPTNIEFVCRAHHSWIDDHPRAAELLGLLVPSWATKPEGTRWIAAGAQEYLDTLSGGAA